jgi:hypothetical protein
MSFGQLTGGPMTAQSNIVAVSTMSRAYIFSRALRCTVDVSDSESPQHQ